MLIGRPGVCPFLGIDFSKRLYFNIIGIHSKNLSIYRCQCFYYSIYAAISQENIIKHIRAETINQRVWQDIHPNISRVSKDLFCDGHFAAAAEIAIKEVETQMRILFKQYNPTAVDPKDAASLIGALLSENGLHKFCDTSNTSGRNYRKGIQQIFEGAFSAYRNPTMHQNLPYTQREALEQITLASQMMYILLGEEVQVGQ